MKRGDIFKAFRVYRRALAEARGHWPALLLILAIGLAAIPLSLVAPLPLKLVVDNVLGGKPLEGLAAALLPAAIAADPARLLAAAIALSLALAGLGIVCRLGDWLLRESVADRMVLGFRCRLLRHGLRLPWLYHAANGTFDTSYRITQDAQALQWTAIYGFIPVAVAAANIACTLYVTARISAPLAAIALGTALPTIALVHVYQHRLKARWHRAKEEESAAQRLVHEVLGAARAVVLFGQEQRETERFRAHARSGIAARLRAIRVEAALAALLAVGAGIGTAAILYLGVRAVELRTLSVGELLMVITYIGQLYAPLQAIGTHASGQQHAVASLERAIALLDRAPELAERPDAEPRGAAGGEIAFDGVWFAYGDNPAVLRDTSFVIPAGGRVGITGRTGSGKSTLINLILRLADPIAGAIRLDGVDLRDWRLADLRRQFAVVTQDAALFATTIAQNIAYGRPDASREEIVAAAKAASIDEAISALPQAYDTPVGEHGTTLSGGERQRIALARALLVAAPILVLDEPTSAVDRATEAAMIESLDRLCRGRTILIVTHRPAALAHVDFQLEVESGRVTLRGLREPPALRKAS